MHGVEVSQGMAGLRSVRRAKCRWKGKRKGKARTCKCNLVRLVRRLASRARLEGRRWLLRGEKAGSRRGGFGFVRGGVGRVGGRRRGLVG